MAESNRRFEGPDRRRASRGGRRTSDQPGRYPVVLVADAYSGVRKACARYLDRFHFQVHEATDGEEILASLAVSLPSVIVADADLPHMSAERLRRSLAEQARGEEIPIIVMAAGELDAEIRFPHPVKSVLVKPFSLATMLEEVRKALRR